MQRAGTLTEDSSNARINQLDSDVCCLVVDPILKWCGGHNRRLSDKLLDLRISLAERTNPLLCLNTYFTLKAAIHPDWQKKLLSPLEFFLVNNIAIRALNTDTKRSCYYRIFLDYSNTSNFLCAFKRAYHQVECCKQCPGNPQFDLVFLDFDMSIEER